MRIRTASGAVPNDAVVGDYAELLLGWSFLAEGSEPPDPVRFTQLVAGLMETGLDSAPASPAASATSGDAPAAEASEMGADAPSPESSGAPAAASGTQAEAAGEGTIPSAG